MDKKIEEQYGRPNIMEVESVSVEEILNRTDSPTFGNKFCAVRWDMSKKENKLHALEELTKKIVDSSNNIFRGNLRNPANIIVIPNNLYFLLAPKIKSVSTDKHPNFIDAEFLGIFLNRFFIFKSEKMPDNLIMTALESNGLKYIYTNSSNKNSIPEINITQKGPGDKYNKKGEIEFWSFIELKYLANSN